MSLRIMCAGCSKEERDRAEVAVKRVLRHVPATEAWTVSLVKTREQWSVTLDAPAANVRALTVLAPESRLGESITEALRNTQASRPPAPPASRPSAPPAGATDRLQCEKCGRPFRVIYESHPGEASEEAPVACPHCWHGNRARVGAEAAETRDYRAEKLDS
jgi:DNA-directed RNA polymerase subunit RPC12/RpoP